MGIKLSPTTEMAFNNVRVPQENLIGQVNRGFYQVLEFFDESRVLVGSQALGISQGLLIVLWIMPKRELSLDRSWLIFR